MKKVEFTKSQLQTLGFILSKFKDSLEYDSEFESYFTQETNELNCLDVDDYKNLCEILAEVNNELAEKYIFCEGEVFPLKGGGYEFGNDDIIEFDDPQTINDMKKDCKEAAMKFIERTNVDGRDTFVFLVGDWYLGRFIKI